jgi:serine protease AprX
MKVLDSNGMGRTSDVIRALEFAVANRRVLDIDVINLSLGHPVFEPAASDPLVQAVEAAVRAGIVVVTAAGNVGTNEETGQLGYAGITSPGNAPSAITAGALDDLGTVRRDDDRVAAYSSRGPTWYDALAKPDLVAPGHRLVSDASRTSTLYQSYPDLRVGPNHLRLSGTSMAAAATAGAAALVLEANRALNGYPAAVRLGPNGVRAILEFTAVQISTASGVAYDTLEQGAGGLNAGGAIELARRLDTSVNIRSWWLTAGVQPFTAIGGQLVPWAQKIVYGTRLLRGSAIYVRQAAWMDDIVWGTRRDIIWGTFDARDIVWGTAGDDIVWGTNVVWGNDRIGTTRDRSVMWGTRSGDDIVWGTIHRDDIVWGTLRSEDIIWGTFNPDDIVWGTLYRDDIVWGTLKRPDDIIWGTAFLK